MTDHHKIPTVQNIDWAAIRLRYMRGETPYAISKSLQGRPTRQRISRKAKQEGWGQGLPGIVASNHLARPTRSPSKDTPEKRERVIEILSKGGTFRPAGPSSLSPPSAPALDFIPVRAAPGAANFRFRLQTCETPCHRKGAAHPFPSCLCSKSISKNWPADYKESVKASVSKLADSSSSS